jgi:hypothetical protein
LAIDDPARAWAQPGAQAGDPDAAAARLEQALDRIAALARHARAERERLAALQQAGQGNEGAPSAAAGFDSQPVAERLDRLIAQLRAALAPAPDAH